MPTFHNRTFRLIAGKKSSACTEGLEITFQHLGSVVWASYENGNSTKGWMIGAVMDDGSLSIDYKEVSPNKRLTGTSLARLIQLESGKIRLIEEWKTDTGSAGGQIVYEELI